MTLLTQTLTLSGDDGIKLIADGIGNPDDTPVLFAHGGGQTRHAWGGTAQAIAEKGFYALSLDLRGHGDSSWCPGANYDLDFYARDLVQVAKTLKQKPHVVGASLGGLAAMLVEGRIAPDTFASLTMVDITPRMEESGVEQILTFMSAHSERGFASLEEAADIIAEYLPHRKRPKDTNGLAKNLRLGSDGRYRWHWDPAFVTSSNTARESRSTEGSSKNLDEVAAGVKLPTHLIRGRLSQLVSEEAVEHFLEVVPQAHYTDISGAGHMIAGDKNDVFSEAVISFIRSS
jgi:pimeloyl-ACP methyl ester carboxylesterase